MNIGTTVHVLVFSIVCLALMESVRPMTHVPETGTKNRYRKNGTGFCRVCHAIWYQIFPVPDSGDG